MTGDAAEVDVAASVSSGVDARLALLRELRARRVPQFCKKVQRLVVLHSSSRGGSSMLAEVLRSSENLIHLRGELTPFLRMVGLSYPQSGTGSDYLGAEHLHSLDLQSKTVLDTELALDAGTWAQRIEDEERFALDTAWRLIVQWPGLDLDPSDITKVTLKVLRELQKEHDWGLGCLGDPALYQLGLLRELCDRGVAVSARYYDLSDSSPERDGWGITEFAPDGVIIEEPPFVLPKAWRLANEADLATKPLVIKSPSNAYRPDFLRALFPNAEIRVLYLTRNPAAAINGLYDGWLYDGFHAHRMKDPLQIDGYGISGNDTRWWKFDLPPGWDDYATAPLANVCAYQWRRCHEAILADLGACHDHLRLRFEDLVMVPEQRVRGLARISEWLDIPFEGNFERVVQHGVGPIAATLPPSRQRWRHRAEAIYPVLDKEVRSVARELGYVDEASWD